VSKAHARTLAQSEVTIKTWTKTKVKYERSHIDELIRIVFILLIQLKIYLSSKQ
jgi:hypothetical protein